MPLGGHLPPQRLSVLICTRAVPPAGRTAGLNKNMQFGVDGLALGLLFLSFLVSLEYGSAFALWPSPTDPGGLPATQETDTCPE